MGWGRGVASGLQLQCAGRADRDTEAASDASLSVPCDGIPISAKRIHPAPLEAVAAGNTLILIHCDDKTRVCAASRGSVLDASENAAMATTAVAYEVEVFAGVTGAMHQTGFLRSL